MKSQFWDPSAGLHGMFNLWSFENIDAICASGLGGGSLIYANVLLRKDEDWFVTEEPGHGSWKGGYEHWPVTRADLDPHYDRVEQMMNVQKYPLDQAPFDQAKKVLAFRDAARKLGHDWDLVNLAVTFANDGDPARVGEPIREARPNIHGATRLTCKLTGECDLGSTTAPRTRWTTRTSPPPGTPARTSAPAPRCAPSSPARAAATACSTSSTRRRPRGCRRTRASCSAARSPATG